MTAREQAGDNRASIRATGLQALDDLQRKIMLDALAMTLGVGWVVGIALFLAYTGGPVHVDLNVAVVVMAVVMSVAYAGACIAGRLRYR